MKILYIKVFSGNQWNPEFRTIKSYLINENDIDKFDSLYSSSQKMYDLTIGNKEFINRFKGEYYLIDNIPQVETIRL